MIEFPTYVQILGNSYQETHPQELIRTEFDAGPAKVRKSTCSVAKIVRFNIVVCDDDYRNFLDWYNNDICRGALFFKFNDPSYNPAKCRKARIISDIQFSASNDGFDKWGAQLTLEVF